MSLKVEFLVSFCASMIFFATFFESQSISFDFDIGQLMLSLVLDSKVFILRSIVLRRAASRFLLLLYIVLRNDWPVINDYSLINPFDLDLEMDSDH